MKPLTEDGQRCDQGGRGRQHRGIAEPGECHAEGADQRGHQQRDEYLLRNRQGGQAPDHRPALSRGAPAGVGE
jgi:hypothetical protein